MIATIHALIQELQDKHKTTIPSSICKSLNIKIKFIPTSISPHNINGCLIKFKHELWCIGLKDDLNYWQQEITIAHELAHYHFPAAKLSL